MQNPHLMSLRKASKVDATDLPSSGKIRQVTAKGTNVNSRQVSNGTSFRTKCHSPKPETSANIDSKLVEKNGTISGEVAGSIERVSRRFGRKACAFRSDG